MHNITSLILVLMLAAFSACAPDVATNEAAPVVPAYVSPAVDGSGTLFIIGGGKRSQALVSDLTGRMANPDGLILILPMASEEPDSAAWYASRQFMDAGKTHIRSLNLTPADTVGARVDSLLLADLIYLCGGDQNRFMDVAAHPAVRQKIHQAFASGAVIAGTSAGAAVMSSIMITGDQQLEPEYEATYRRLMADNAVYSEGLGLLPKAIVDQHFVERSRYNRAITAAHDHQLPVYGIGESTALVVTPTGLEVVGDGQVVVFRPDTLYSDASGRIGGAIEIEIMIGRDAQSGRLDINKKAQERHDNSKDAQIGRLSYNENPQHPH